MKSKLAYWLLSALLVFSLTACGCTATPQNENKPNDSTQEDTNQNHDTQNGSSSVIGGENDANGSSNGTAGDNSNTTHGDTTQTPMEEGLNDIGNDVENAIDDVTGSTRPDEGGVPFDDMLENGRIKR